jgi:hypothetical protein
MEWVVREGVGAGGRNDPSIVCTYELKKRIKHCTIMSSSVYFQMFTDHFDSKLRIFFLGIHDLVPVLSI